ncbi:hypothetical protein QL285_076271 [Trifolium repens]|jgi:hypothetical protein|nr:hypothetical protein QL285_076271 [Trifolium repens]
MTKSGRFARAVQECTNGRGKNAKKNMKRKGRPKAQQVEDSDDSISNVSLVPAPSNISHSHLVPVPSLAAVLVEGEVNEINEATSRQYRVEAERLFNIGLNMGVTTNADRISMVERLVDSEIKDDDSIDGWEEDEVDQ